MSEEAHGEEKKGESHGGGHGGGGHSGGGHEEGHEGAPEWLISFADNVALLMGFFVILLAMNMGPKATPVQGGEQGKKGGVDTAMEAIIGIRKAFHTELDPKNPEDAQVLRYIEMRDAGRANEAGIPGTYTNVQALQKGNFKNVTGLVTFDDRSAVLSPTGRKTLSDVAAKERDQRWVIEVRGHVSPFECMRDNTKAMNLSFERAMAAAQALVEAGLKWENLRPVACGANDRVVARTFDPQEDRSNQRVEIVVTNEPVSGDPNIQPAAAPGKEPSETSADAGRKDSEGSPREPK